ncbi:hypothetical protein A2291_03680 [candidate division WOR-1 bacterium RIFOXYB2_FULL_42_35]|uniref:Uncharacterized protein n=1 Tax=candidate division WOR-1 bacterium RIFOXYC2_FULL_41_25 TaxID=1802586 RepID=A0A1F4TQK1_UNCSA|nr:MAG: hypothetical protein A2247_03250 [candidate division WOR-1 bacterium RIFOXYA2_FULL_41_14]OGC25563.1 MAG: hypothetical protein A2291_03680 [candidate division WOR-1 bacterium RIFOXYB2_FULL_42_35]OGC34995.1 MAG: hypothetical protein A2462_05310 [candidate division WOR-1 bacterium RIFOXYC2_FULL_41_25]OGC41788.1 MAG: hypothetical protein A2548_03495 [candidate division WOR-1 bacterium RIFOXYD2_FULL_41_8]
MFPEENDNKEMSELEEALKEMWLEQGNPSVIAAKHAEFVVEPKVFFGNKLNPAILKLLVVNYLAHTSTQDSGAGNVDVTPEKLVIKSPKGKPLVIVRDKKIIGEYLQKQG